MLASMLRISSKCQYIMVPWSTLISASWHVDLCTIILPLSAKRSHSLIPRPLTPVGCHDYGTSENQETSHPVHFRSALSFRAFSITTGLLQAKKVRQHDHRLAVSRSPYSSIAHYNDVYIGTPRLCNNLQSRSTAIISNLLDIFYEECTVIQII